MEFIATIVAILATVPFVTFFMLFIIEKKRTKTATVSTKRAADVTTALLLIAVYALIEYIFDVSLFWETVIIYMVLLAIVLTVQWRKEEEITFLRAVRFVWRLSFVMLSVAYLLLVIIAIMLQF
ncbi:asparagine N-glycosylation enzyme membrane subunit Stt3 [Alkalibacillus flavidus]|uniref:Asparagine N-glycosylation enzyme membrane subunit Stt3 n=1 Tax=Alkalibacillus flavidus TaxID=546021 RepID=A0ABV2KR37_9BACI